MADKEWDAWMASVDVDCAADYLRRGRRYASLPAEDLPKSWQKAFRAWVQIPNSELMRREKDDLGAELELRGIPLPLAEVADAAEVLRNKAAEAIRQLESNPERYREVAESLEEDLEVFRRRHDLKN
jgi:hypothetical protein